MKIKILRTIIIILLIETFFMIFGFSSQNGEKSGNLSGKIAKFIVEQVQKNEVKNREEIVQRTEKVIRKVAHFSIYTLVGFLLMSFVSTYQLSEKKRILISLVAGILYATSDEIHQAFVPGRSPQITDVILDTMGVVLGILLLLSILEIGKKIKINQIKEKS